MGATLGQGYRFGRPRTLPGALPASGPAVPFLGSDLHRGGPTPFDLVRRRTAMRRGAHGLVQALVAHLEELALGLGPAAVVLTSCDDELLRLGGPERLVALAAQAALVGVVGPAPRPGLPFRAGPVPEGDPLRSEWSVVVLSPHFAAALTARRLGDGRPAESSYEFAVTHARDLVSACARSLAARLAPAAG